MAGEHIEIELSEEMARRLRQAAQQVGLADIRDAVIAAIGEWVARYGTAATDDESDGKYFVNEALDDLVTKRRG